MPLTPVNTCALYGVSNYTNNWIGINLLIVLMSMMVVAAVYAISRFLPGRTRGRITEMTKSEITQSVLSVLIIAILVGSAQVACNATASIGKTVLSSIQPGLPASETSLSPFAFADYYIGQLALQTGMTVLTTIYAQSITYAVQANIYGAVGGFLSSLPFEKIATPTVLSSVVDANGKQIPILSITISFTMFFNLVLRILSDSFLAIYAPVATIVIGALFVQYLAIPLMQYTAFVVVLPIAIALRSISFSGNMLRNTSNAVLAIAIAAYLIYPLTVLFDSYVIYWMWSPTLNPSAIYLSNAFTLTPLKLSDFYSQNPSSIEGITTFVNSALQNTNSDLWTLIDPFHNIVEASKGTIDALAELVFQGIVLFAMNLAITIGFAMGLAKALNSGIEGAGSFWSNL
jgi:hypothetical protein